MRTLHTAELMLPMTGGIPVLRNAGVLVDGTGVVLAVDDAARLRGSADASVAHQVLMPGVVNAHVHLIDAPIENPVPGGDGLVRWVERLLELRGTIGEVDDDAIERVLVQMRAAGTVAIGEVANSLATLAAIERSGIRCRFIHELIGFRSIAAEEILSRSSSFNSDSPDVAYTLGAHAPYSVSPQLMQLIAQTTRAAETNLFQHLAEDPDERELFEHAGGPWRTFLEKIGVWDPGFDARGVSPIAAYDSLGIIDKHYVAVHLTDARPDELELLAYRGARAVLSPTSNLHITGRLPDVQRIVDLGIRFGLGTDGRGSNPSVDVFDEARILLEADAELPDGRILEALTTDGADILQFDDIGSIDVGNRPGLLSVEIPQPSDDLHTLEHAVVCQATSRAPVG